MSACLYVHLDAGGCACVYVEAEFGVGNQLQVFSVSFTEAGLASQLALGVPLSDFQDWNYRCHAQITTWALEI